MDEKKDCYESLFSEQARCKECVFSSENSLRCMCPAIYENPPQDSYFKYRSEQLTKIENETIEKYTT